MNTQLQYTFNPIPNPFTVGISDGSLSLLITNPSKNSINLKGITVKILTGTGEKELTNFPDKIVANPPEGFKMAPKKKAKDSITFIMAPSSGDYYTFPTNKSAIFEMTNIVISTQGLASIVIVEGSKDQPTCQKHISKFPKGWGSINFTALPSSLTNAGEVTLNWSGPEKAKYTISYLDSDTQQTVTIPSQGQTPLNSLGPYPGPNNPPLTINATTTFNLFVEANILGQKYNSEMQQVVNVGEIPTVTLFKGTISGPPDEQVISLIWNCSDNTDHVLVSWNDDIMVPNPHHPKILNLPFTNNEFSVIAVSSDDTQSKPSIVKIILRWQSIKEIEAHLLPLRASIFPNGQYAFLTQESKLFYLFDIKNLSISKHIQFYKDITKIIISKDGLKGIGMPYSGNHIALINIAKMIVKKDVGQWGWKINTDIHIDDVVISSDSKYWFGINTNPSYNNMSILCGSFENFAQPIRSKLGIYNANLIAVASNSQNKINCLIVGDQLGTLFFIDAISLKTIKKIDFAVGQSIDVSPDGLLAIVTHNEGQSISVIDIKLMKVTKTFNVNMFPEKIVFTSDGKRVLIYASDYNLYKNQIVIINLSTLTIIKEISSGHWPTEMVITPDDNFAVFGDMQSNNVKVLDLNDYTVSEHMASMPRPAYHLNITPDGKYIFVTYGDFDKMSILQRIWTSL